MPSMSVQRTLLTHLPALALVIFVVIAYHNYVALDKIYKDKENSMYGRELIGINLVDGSTLQCTPMTVLTGRIVQGFHVIAVMFSIMCVCLSVHWRG